MLKKNGVASCEVVSLWRFAPARFLKLHPRVVDLAAVDLVVLIGNVGPRAEMKRHAIAGAQASDASKNVVVHAFGVNECFQSRIFFAAFDCEISQMKSENVIFVGNGAGTRDG